MQKTVKYIGFYDNEVNAQEGRYYTPAAKNKMDYVCDVLTRGGFPVEIVSPSCVEHRRGWFKGKKYELSPMVRVCLPPCPGEGGLLTRILRHFWQRIVNTLYIARHISRGDTVIAYHSVSLARTLVWLKKHKKINLILHVEEIYADVNNNKEYRKNELRTFAIADAFIFPTKMLNEAVNTSGRPNVIAHGCYQVEEKIAQEINDGRVHCVYAGTFDRTKGGCMAAIAAAKYLGSNYCMHIIGFGSHDEVQEVKQAVAEANHCSACEIIYDGIKKGKEFVEYLQGCHIGVSSQNSGGTFNDTSFPSKVLTYLANGLSVVSIHLPVLESSDVDDFLYYYDNDDPRLLAAAIEQCASDGHKKDPADQLRYLDDQFLKGIKRMMEEINNEEIFG